MKQHADNRPPVAFIRFFRWFCDPVVAEDIEGDLTEMFERDMQKRAGRSARWHFRLNVIRLFRPGIIKKLNTVSSFTQPSIMFKNYFLTSVRSLARSRGFSA